MIPDVALFSWKIRVLLSRPMRLLAAFATQSRCADGRTGAGHDGWRAGAPWLRAGRGRRETAAGIGATAA